MVNPIDRISQVLINLYSDRYKKMGYDVKTLGWGDTEQQIYRFQQAIDELSFDDQKSILDIGCGFGDFISLINKKGIKYNSYLGWDLNPDLILESKKIWSNYDKINFEVQNLAEVKNKKNIADIGVMFGVLNLNLKDQYDNYLYSEQFISNAFNSVNEVLVVDFLSLNTTSEYPIQDINFYHDPIKMLEFALTLTPNVLMKHNYSSIPQKEFMLFLYK